MNESKIYGQLLRTAYGMDGINAHGVDDDVYADMERGVKQVELMQREFAKNDTCSSKESLIQLETKARISIVRIRMNVSGAITEALKSSKLKNASKDITDNLKELRSRLGYDEYDITAIEKLISQVWVIFIENELSNGS